MRRSNAVGLSARAALNRRAHGASDATSATLTSNIAAGQTYYWRVRGSNGTITSGWSTPQQFRTPSAGGEGGGGGSRTLDPPYNCKRGDCRDPSVDVVNYFYGIGSEAESQGSTEVYIIDIISAVCPGGDQ